MQDSSEQPVFFDPGQKRWPWLRRVFFLFSFAVFILLVCLSISIAINPVLPTLGLRGPDEAEAGPPLEPPTAKPTLLPPVTPAPVTAETFKEARRRLMEAQRQAAAERQRGRTPKRAPPPGKAGTTATAPAPISPPPPPKPLTMAFYVNWEETSLTSLKQNIDSLDVVIPEWLKLTAEGKVEPLQFGRQQEVSRLLRQTQPGPKVVPLLTNYSSKGWLSEETGRLLATTAGRAAVISGLLEYARNFPLDGFCLDLEAIPLKMQPGYTSLMAELAARLHADKLALYVCAPPEMPSPVCRRAAQVADMVLVLAYAQHSDVDDPGPLAAQDWFENMIQRRATEVPPDKLGIAFGNYVCDWREKSSEVTSRTYDKALVIAREQGALVRLDAVSLNPAFRYEDGKGRRHDVWLLDAITAFNQLAAARKLSPRGFALWRLGSEDPALWRFFGRTEKLDLAVSQTLGHLEFKYGIDYEGKGEIIRIATTPSPGRRRITFDEQRGLIVACEYEKLPTPYIVRQYGFAPKKIALTFDDGPDPKYTPTVLDVLKQAGVPATFFVVGGNAELYTDLLRRMDAEGHEIGNHTFTHPNISNISPSQLQLELSATQRLFESILGRQSLLFRPPYGEDSDPSTAEEVQALETVNNLGYLTVGMRLDPSDWQSPPPEEIVRRVVDGADSGKGNVVLLHDSGGDRANTLAALPLLIAELRERGYEFVTVSALLGRTRDDVMPPLAVSKQVPATLNRLAFGLVGGLLSALTLLFTLGIILGLARLGFIGLLAVVDARRKRRLYFFQHYKPTVAVIVPAYNEEKVIAQTIKSLLDSNYPHPFELIVVDDGSKDQTYERAKEAFGLHPQVKIFKKLNGGKPAALNFGVAMTDAEIVVAMDADTVFPKDTITKLVRHFSFKGIGAVAGNAKVGNRVNILTKWQALEYITSQNLDRRAFNVLDCITVVPGAVGAWRRDLVVKAGGFGHSTLAEDADLTIAIRRMGYSIVNEDEAYGYTEAPDTIRGFVRQRYRWMFGTLQAAWKHKRALFNPRYGALGFVALPNILIFQVFFPLISPVMDLLTLGTVASHAWSALHGRPTSTDALLTVLAYYALFTAVDFAAALLAFALEPQEDKSLLWWLFPQRFCYRQLMYYVAIKSTLAALRGVEVGWGKLERKATVTTPTR